MSAEVLSFPGSLSPRLVAGAGAPVARPADAGARFPCRRTYTLGDMIRLCGLEDYETRTAIEHLRLMARQKGLPLPRNLRVFGQQLISGPAAIGRRSKWDALAVDAWLDQPPPHGGGAALAPPEGTGGRTLPAPRRVAMRDRARQLAAGAR